MLYETFPAKTSDDSGSQRWCGPHLGGLLAARLRLNTTCWWLRILILDLDFIFPSLVLFFYYYSNANGKGRKKMPLLLTVFKVYLLGPGESMRRWIQPLPRYTRALLQHNSVWTDVDKCLKRASDSAASVFQPSCVAQRDSLRSRASMKRTPFLSRKCSMRSRDQIA